MIQLFASDLDGTLLNKDHALDELILSRINQLLEAGRTFSVATGRDQNSLPKEFTREGIYRVCMNGSKTVDWNDRVIHAQPLDKEVVQKVLQKFPEVNFVFMCNEGKLTTRSEEDVLRRILESPNWKHNPNPELAKMFMNGYYFDMSKEEILKHDVYKMDAHECTETQKQQIQDFVDQYPDQLINAPSYPHLIELTHPLATKGQAIMRLADRLGIEQDQVAVYGDGWNDADMMRLFDHSYAPENAEPRVKELAKEVIGHNHDYAVSEHMVSLLQK